MNTIEIDCTLYGEMMDYLNANAIYNGTAKQKKETKFETMSSVIFDF